MITTNLSGDWQFCRRAVMGLLCSVALPITGLCAGEPLIGAIKVDAEKFLGPVNPLVFGHNVESGDSAGIFGNVTRKEKIYQGDGFWLPEQQKPSAVLLDKAREIGTSMLRYPGGCLVHNFDWRKTVGPRDKRGDWQFGLDEFLQVCREINAEPLIMVSDYVLPAEEMPKHAAELVEYLNAPATKDHPWAMKRKEWGHPEPYKVKWFELGNESDNGNHDLKPPRRFSPEGYAKYALDCIAAMKAVDPTIKVGVHSATTALPENEWNRTVYRLTGKKADFIVAHLYLGGSGQSINETNEYQAYKAGLSVCHYFENLLSRYNQLILKECGRSLPLALTEYNNSFGGDKPKPYRFTLAGGLVAADAIRMLLKPENNVGMANFWQMFHGYFGPLRVDLKSSPDYKTTELAGFKLYRLWGQHFGSELVEVDVKSPKLEIEGYGTISPSRGEEMRAAQLLKEIPVESQLTLDEIDHPKVKASITEEGWLRMDVDAVTGNAYLPIGHYARPAEVGADGADYNLFCEARFIPAPNSELSTASLGLGDDRGWDRSQSAITISGINGPEWKEISGTLRCLKDAPGVMILVRLEPGAKVLSGRLEVRNLKLRAYSKALYPAYDLLTASASLSRDKSKLYVIVFNKSSDRTIIAPVKVNGFMVASARRWEVNGSSLGAVDGVDEVATNALVNVIDNTARLGFPPHSMTALEFSKIKPNQK